MYLRLVTIILACLYCVRGFGFSDHKLDQTLIKQDSTLVHFADRIEGRSEVVVSDLLRAPDLHFSAAPDPSALMKKMNATNSKKKPKNPVEISVLSYNVALLHAKIFRLITVVKSPFITQRLRKLPDLIFQRNLDIILLQELWSDKLPPFMKKAEEYGYQGFFGTERCYEDGLAIFVKKTLLKDAKNTRVSWQPFEEQYAIENFPGALGVQRGFLHVQFDSPKLGRFHIYNTHLQSFRKHWRKRNLQARELGILVEERTLPEDIVFVGGDINASPYFRDDVWTDKDSDTSKSWWSNSIAYGLLLYYGGLEDAMVAGMPSELANIDVVAAKQFRRGVQYCDGEKHLSFTATDCNGLNQMQYKDTEPPARQDHIMIRDDLGRVKVIDRGIIFTEKVDFGEGLVVEPSDHYGVFIKAAIGAVS